jgi:hypothetical protein
MTRTGWQRLLQLVCLVRVRDAECIEVPAAPNLELGDIPRLFDLHRSCILAPSGKEKLLDFFDLFRLQNFGGNKSTGVRRIISIIFQNHKEKKQNCPKSIYEDVVTPAFPQKQDYKLKDGKLHPYWSFF